MPKCPRTKTPPRRRVPNGHLNPAKPWKEVINTETSTNQNSPRRGVGTRSEPVGVICERSELFATAQQVCPVHEVTGLAEYAASIRRHPSRRYLWSHAHDRSLSMMALRPSKTNYTRKDITGLFPYFFRRLRGFLTSGLRGLSLFILFTMFRIETGWAGFGFSASASAAISA